MMSKTLLSELVGFRGIEGQKTLQKTCVYTHTSPFRVGVEGVLATGCSGRRNVADSEL